MQEYFGEQQFPPDGWDDYHHVYPPQPRRLSMEVPRRLREDHAEAVKCIDGKTYKAAAVMARRIVEGITVDKGYTSGALFSRLKAMKKDGVIDARLYDWADIGRDVGNQGAHASKARRHGASPKSSPPACRKRCAHTADPDAAPASTNAAMTP